MKIPPDGPLLNKREIAAYLKVAPRTIEDWVYRRKIPFLKVGRAVRFDAHEVSLWLDSQRLS